MKFLIVGASGFLGRHVMARASSLGHETVGTQCRSQRPALVTFDLLRHRISERVSPSFLGGNGPIFGVIAATISPMDRCVLEPETSYKVDVEGTLTLIEDMISLGIKPVFLSSSFVYDGEKGGYGEDHPHNPISAYWEAQVAGGEVR